MLSVVSMSLNVIAVCLHGLKPPIYLFSFGARTSEHRWTKAQGRSERGPSSYLICSLALVDVLGVNQETRSSQVRLAEMLSTLHHQGLLRIRA